MTAPLPPPEPIKVPYPEFIDEGMAPGRKVWMICAANDREPDVGTIHNDGSEDEIPVTRWNQLRRWELGVWGAVYDGDSGVVLCAVHVTDDGHDVVSRYSNPDRERP